MAIQVILLDIAYDDKPRQLAVSMTVHVTSCSATGATTCNGDADCMDDPFIQLSPQPSGGGKVSHGEFHKLPILVL